MWENIQCTSELTVNRRLTLNSFYNIMYGLTPTSLNSTPKQTYKKTYSESCKARGVYLVGQEKFAFSLLQNLLRVICFAFQLFRNKAAGVWTVLQKVSLITHIPNKADNHISMF